MFLFYYAVHTSPPYWPTEGIVSWFPFLFPLLEGPHPGEALTGSVDTSVCAGESGF